MAKTIFNPDGLQEKLQELYRLSDESLLAQARSMCYSLPNWLRDHFELDDDQVAYLDRAPENAKFAWGAQFAAVVVGRGDVTMDPPIAAKGKVTGGTINGGTTYNPNTGATFTLGGTIKFGN